MEGKKKTLGRRKIQFKKIDKQSTLQVTFSKRRRGLFRKASELSLLCGAEVAIVVQSPAEKVFTFGHPSVEVLLSRVSPPSAARIIRHDDYEAAIKKLVAETNEIDVDGGFWWEKPFEGMELRQLEDFLAALVRQRDTINSAAASSIQEFCAASRSAAAPVQEFTAAASSIQEFSGADSSIQELSGADSSIQEFSGADSVLGSSYLSHSFDDQNQDFLDVLDSLINPVAAAPVQEFSDVATSIREFSAAASGLDSSYLSQPLDQDEDLFVGLDSMINPAPAASVQDFSGAASSIQQFSAAAPVQEFTAASSIQEFSGADSSIQEFSGASSGLDFQPFDQDQDLYVGLDSMINPAAAAPVQEFSGAASASGSDSSYHFQPFDEDQDMFDVLDLSYLLQPSDQDEDYHELFN